MTMSILGDRRLTSDEMERFKRGDGSFQALPLICGFSGCVLGNREPTLFEIALVELTAKLDGLVKLHIKLGREIRQLQARSQK